MRSYLLGLQIGSLPTPVKLQKTRLDMPSRDCFPPLVLLPQLSGLPTVTITTTTISNARSLLPPKATMLPALSLLIYLPPPLTHWQESLAKMDAEPLRSWCKPSWLPIHPRALPSHDFAETIAVSRRRLARNRPSRALVIYLHSLNLHPEETVVSTDRLYRMCGIGQLAFIHLLQPKQQWHTGSVDTLGTGDLMVQAIRDVQISNLYFTD